MRFFGVEHSLDVCGWDNSTVDRLWRYHMHYFDDLNAEGAERRRTAHRELIDQWIDENVPGSGTGWEPYPISRRLVNWVKCFLAGVEPKTTWISSLAVQARWLEQRLEWHLLGNHLLANAKALVFAGCYFTGPEAEHWLRRGIWLLRRELKEQVLQDGGHFERSPMYHALCLEDVLDLVNLGRAMEPQSGWPSDLAADLSVLASSMLHWLRCMLHPDGTLGLFNDCAAGMAPSAAEIERYAASLCLDAEQPTAEAVTHLSSSGYVRIARGRAVALLDLAPVGPDYLPGHAHADTLSFELSLHGRRVIVNGGTSRYGIGPERLRERGTAAHSTVQVADTDSSEIWAGFRVGRRARPFDATVDGWTVCCSHDGYRHLPGRPVHRRCWHVEPAQISISDYVSAPGVPAVARYVLAPGLSASEVSTGRWQIRMGDDLVVELDVLRGRGVLCVARHAPEFGVSVAVQSLVVQLLEGVAQTRWSWPSQ